MGFETDLPAWWASAQPQAILPSEPAQPAPGITPPVGVQAIRPGVDTFTPQVTTQPQAPKPGSMSFSQMMQMLKMMETPQGPRMGQVGAGHAQALPTRQYQAAMVNAPALQAPPTLAALLAGRR